MNTSIPQNIPEYLEHRLGALAEACRLALALDPEGRLKLAVNAELTDADGKRWRVIRFRNDDLALRRRLSKEERCLIWAQPPLTSPDAAIDLSYLPDVVGRLADEQVIDASLLGVLKALMPNEVFPQATPTYAAYFADRLPDLVREHKELREHTRFRPPLSDEHVQALALCCRHPELKAGDLLFRETDLPSALRRYLWLLTEAQWTDDEAVLLRHLARQSPLDEGPKARLAAWLEPGVADALRMVYLRWVAHVAGLSENVAGQIQSTGLCGGDPRALERE
ncbi:MAG: hypothetical protein FJ279_24055, partial [Planctomycetes bacterium]|nr:hypothetical protein [Planctomycetota bacterium]